MKKEKALRHFQQKITDLAALNEDNFIEVTRWLSACKELPGLIDSAISNPLLPSNVQLEYTKKNDCQILNILEDSSSIYVADDPISLDWCADCLTQLSKDVSARWIESLPAGLRKLFRWAPTQPVKLSVFQHDIKLSSIFLRRSWLRPIPPLSNVTFDDPYAILRTEEKTELIDAQTGKTINSVAGYSVAAPDTSLCTLTTDGFLYCTKGGSMTWQRTYKPYLNLDLQDNVALLFDESVIHIVEIETGLNLSTATGRHISRCVRNGALFVLKTNDSFEIEIHHIDARNDHALVVEDFELVEYFWGISVAVHLGGKTTNGANVLLTLDWQRQVLKKHILPPGEWLDVKEHIDTVVILYKVRDTSIAIEVNSSGDITHMHALPIKNPISLLTLSAEFFVIYSVDGTIHCVDRAQIKPMWHLDVDSPTGLPQAIFWTRGLALFSSRLNLVEPYTGRQLALETLDYLETVRAHYCGGERFIVNSRNGYLLGLDVSGFLASLPQMPK